MTQRNRCFVWLVVCSLLSVFLAACHSSVAGNSGAYVSYKPPLIPVQVSVDDKGTISVSANYSISTPIGVFSAGVYTNPSEYFKVQNTLTVRLNDRDTIYPLTGSDFDIQFESGYYERVRLEKAGHNLLLELRKIPTSDLSSPALPPTTPGAVVAPMSSSMVDTAPAPAIATMNQQDLANLLGVPKSRVVRKEPYEVHVFDYPLKSEYGQDKEGYVTLNGQRISWSSDSEVMDLSQGYLGPINWYIPENHKIGFCRVGIWTGGGNGATWSNTLRYVQSGDERIYVEAAPRAWIPCYASPTSANWACDEARQAQSATGARKFCWDGNTSQWINVP